MKSELDAAQLFKYGKSTENCLIDDKAFCLIQDLTRTLDTGYDTCVQIAS